MPQKKHKSLNSWKTRNLARRIREQRELDDLLTADDPYVVGLSDIHSYQQNGYIKEAKF